MTVECEKRFFQFNKFTELIYDRVCDREALLNKCSATLSSLLATTEAEKTNSSRHTQVHRELGGTQLKEPCLQALLYDKVIQEKGYSFGSFVEAKEFQLPFCSAVWCGVDVDHKHLLSPAFCASSRFEEFVFKI